jgi:hypothetical protein
MINYNKFSRAYDQKYKIVERKQIRSWSKFYKDKYFSTIDQFLQFQKKDFPFLFTKSDWLNAYKFLYVNVGMSMANWYFNNFEKFATKDLETKNYQTAWEETFANISAQIGTKRITGLSANQRKQLNNLYSKLMRDPKFMALGVPEQTRIIRKQLTYLSKVQATRIVRTETTTASNMAMRESAFTMFDKSSLNKTWQSSFLPTSRDGHMELDGETIPEHEKFLVIAPDGKSDMMSFPGDPAGSAGNVCNCTCKVFYIPKTYNERVVGGDLVDVGFGLVSNTPGGAGDLVSTGVARILPASGGATITPPKEIDDLLRTIRETQRRSNEGDLYAKFTDKMRNYVEELKGFGADLDDYISIINRSQPLNKLRLFITKARKDIRQFYRPSEKKMQLSRAFGRTSQVRTFMHEFGHALDDYFGIGIKNWGSYKPYRFGNEIWKKFAQRYVGQTGLKQYKKFTSMFDESYKKLSNTISQMRQAGASADEISAFVENRLIQIYGDDVYVNAIETLNKYGNKNINPFAIRNEINQQMIYAIDTMDGLFGISKNYPRLAGYGHKVGYMNRNGLAEVVAEAFQYKYFGNYVFQKFNPELFDDLIRVVDQWLASLPKQLANALNYLIKKIKNENTI